MPVTQLANNTPLPTNATAVACRAAVTLADVVLMCGAFSPSVARDVQSSWGAIQAETGWTACARRMA
ncbi:hypothetical protein QFZ65_001878 [Arthrobacter sp. B3I9]|uniref:hypothetical protein n=1 Tax=Arthrobacter sp. B3I9 TaxID=3042270 RepID=UPI00278E45FA|nr:hypothetical protein [Arthrobacter sp. B3I9]MDQ0849940.1 hypothetical protein [Arthrobacter sp. B3I9]